MKKLSLIVVLLLANVVFGQLWSPILSPTSGAGACTLAPTPVAGAAPACAIDWTNAGVPGGIPSGAWTQSGSTITSTGSDQSSQIQTALNACGVNHFVQLAAGVFIINSSVTVPSTCALRGLGANQTTLDAHGTAAGVVILGGTSGVSFAGPSITSGATAGSTSITLSSAAGTVGGYLVISETNAAWVTNAGGEGTATWVDGWSTNGTRARGQIVEVTSVAGNVDGISPALYTDYTLSPVATPFTANAKYAGVENLQILSNNSGYTEGMVYASKCAYCWAKGVEVNYTDATADFVEVAWGFRDEIRDSYFSNSYAHTPGTHDSDIFIIYKTSASKIENNIIERGHASIMLNWGAAGNVVAYNYSFGEFDTGSTNFVSGGLSHHGAHPQFNLIEGNVANVFYPDQVWGSSSHDTIFRNWVKGTGKACNPTSGRGTVNCTGVNGWFPFQASRAMQIGHLSWYHNFVGNIDGSVDQKNLLSGGNPTSHVAILNYPSTRSYDSVNYNMTFGYGESNDDGTGSGCSGGVAPCHGTQPAQTAFLYKEYTFTNTTSNCLVGGNAGSCTASLPASFYLSGKPSWWGSTVPYPAIGPDVTGGSGPGGHVFSTTAGNPAQNCYTTTMGGSDGGAGSPLTFNADACYLAPVLPVIKIGQTAFKGTVKIKY